jgi:predicted acyl esterase
MVGASEEVSRPNDDRACLFSGRGRYRKSFGAPEPFTPNEVTSVAFRLQDVLHTFRKGHRIMVQVQSSWSPPSTGIRRSTSRVP